MAYKSYKLLTDSAREDVQQDWSGQWLRLVNRPSRAQVRVRIDNPGAPAMLLETGEALRVPCGFDRVFITHDAQVGEEIEVWVGVQGAELAGSDVGYLVRQVEGGGVWVDPGGVGLVMDVVGFKQAYDGRSDHLVILETLEIELPHDDFSLQFVAGGVEWGGAGIGWGAWPYVEISDLRLGHFNYSALFELALDRPGPTPGEGRYLVRLRRPLACPLGFGVALVDNGGITNENVTLSVRYREMVL